MIYGPITPKFRSIIRRRKHDASIFTLELSRAIFALTQKVLAGSNHGSATVAQYSLTHIVKAGFNKAVRLTLTVAILAMSFALPTTASAASISRQMALSAKLISSSSDQAVPDGKYDIKFNIYTTETGGTPVWTETQNVSVINGILATRLGSVTAFPDDLTFTGGDFYLSFQVGTDAEMTPRRKIAAVPTAFNSDTVGGYKPGTAANNVLLLDNTGSINIAGGLTVGQTILPVVNNGTINIGSSTRHFGTIFADSIAASNTSISGTDSQAFTINNAQTGNNTDKSSVRFYLGPTINAYSALQWNGPTNSFDLLSNVTNNTYADLNLATLNATTVNSTNLAVDTNTLYVDSINHRVGIGTITPGKTLDVVGTAAVSGATTLASTLGVTGATTLSSTLNVSGAATLSSTLAVTGGTTLTGAVTTGSTLNTGGNFSVNTNKFTVDSSTGNTVAAGTLTAATSLSLTNSGGTPSISASNGNITINGTANRAISFAGANSFSSTLGTGPGAGSTLYNFTSGYGNGFTGTANTFNSSANNGSNNQTGNFFDITNTMSSTALNTLTGLHMNITPALSSSTAWTGNFLDFQKGTPGGTAYSGFKLDSNFKLQFADAAGGAVDTNLYRLGVSSLKTDGALTVGGTLAVTGATTLSSTLAVAGITNSAGYTQSGSSANTLTGATSITAAGTGLAVTNNATIGGTLGVTGAVTTGALTASGAAILQSTLAVTGATTLSSTLGVTGAANLSSDLTVNGNTILGDANTDTLTVNGRLASNILPSVGSSFDLGSSALHFRNFYADNAVFSSTSIANTTQNTFVINSGTAVDADSYLSYWRGNSLTDARIGWDSTNGRLYTNMPMIIQGNSILGSAATQTVTARGQVTLSDSSSTYKLLFGTSSPAGLYQDSANTLATDADLLHAHIGAATVGTTTQNSRKSIFQGSYYNGSSSVDVTGGVYLKVIDTTPTYGLAFQTAGSDRLFINQAGGVGIGATTLSGGKLDVIGSAATTGNYGVVNIGSAATAFDGSTTGKFAGSANGTQLAVNAASGFTGNLIDLQTSGSSMFSVGSTGIITDTANVAHALGGGASGSASLTIFGNGGIRTTYGNNSVNFKGGGTNNGTITNDSGNLTLLPTGGTVNLTGILAVSSNETVGGTLAVTGAVTGGTYNGQTISSTASFTGTINGFTLTGGTTIASGAASNLALQAATGIVNLNTASTQNKLRVYDSTSTKYVELTHDGTNAVISSSSGELQLAGSGTSNVYIGDTGSASNLVFQESSSITGRGVNTITLGQSGDTFNLNTAGVTYNVGTLTATNAVLNTSSTTSTALAVNAPTSFSGNLLDLQVNGSSKFSVNSAGALSVVGVTNTGNSTIAGNLGVTSSATTGTGSSSPLNVVANSLTTGNGFDISSSSLTTGNLINVATTSTAGTASGTSTAINIARSGANANASHTNYGLYSNVTNTGTTSTNVAAYLSASGATNNYGLIVANGSVGVGTTAPSSLLSVGSSSQFQVNSSGAIAAVTGITTSQSSFPITNNMADVNAGVGFVLDAPNLSTNTGFVTRSIASFRVNGTDYAYISPNSAAYFKLGITAAGSPGSGTVGRVNLLDASHYIQATSAFGVTIGTYGAADAITLRQTTGNVGIGTTSPNNRLEVSTSTASTSAIYGTNTAASGTNYGVNGSATGTGATTNYGGYFTASGATTNYAIYAGGNSLFTGNLALNGGSLTSTASTLNIQAAGGVIALNTASAQNYLRVYDSSTTKYAQVTHDGTNGIVSSSSGELQLTGQGTNQLVVGDTGTAVNLVFQESSSITGRGVNTITVGQSGDTFNLNTAGATYNVGTLTATNAILNTSSTTSTALVVNGPSSFSGNLLDLQVNGSSKLSVNSAGALSVVGVTNTGNSTIAGNLAVTSSVTTGTGSSSALNVVANSLTTGNAVDISSSSVTTGNVVNIASTSTAATSNTQTALNVATSGANGTTTQTTYGAQITNTHTGTSSTNVAAYLSASGATNNYGLIVAAGNVGIGTTAPATLTGATGGILHLSAPSTGPVIRLENTSGTNPRAYELANVNFGGSNGRGVGFYDDTASAYRLVLDAQGFVGIGNSAPASMFSVGSTSQFQVSSAGAIAALTGITTSGGYTQSGSTANTFTGASSFTAAGTALSVTNNATISGTLTTTAITSTGSLAVTSASNGDISVTPNGTGKIKLVTSGNASSAVNIGDGGTTNYTKFDTNGAVTFNGAARPYSEMFLLPVDAVTTGVSQCVLSSATAGTDGTNPIYYKTLDCDATAKDGFWQFKMPQNYASGTNVQVDAYWKSDATSGAATVDAGYAAIPAGGTWDSAAITSTTGASQTTSGAAKVNTSTVTLASPSINADDLVTLRTRVSASTLAGGVNNKTQIIKVRIKFLVGS